MDAADAGGEAAAALGGDEGAAPPDLAGGDDSPLLAVPPGSRNSPRLTPGAKGKVYYPKRDDRRKAGGPRSRHFASMHNSEKSSSTRRNVFPGAEINTLYKPIGPNVGIYAEGDTTYSRADMEEESKLFEVNPSIHALLDGLDKKDNILLEQENENKA